MCMCVKPYVTSRSFSLLNPISASQVNKTNELGQLEEFTLPSNETSITLHNLKYSTRYKFYFSAKTFTGSGPSITEEFATIMDTGKLHLPLHDI